MRKEATNTFTEGLIQDLNPINTPNTILTDNLNGTIITYDGNEYSLQNDRGNYPLQYCKLKPNYIPVGVKEYADTLYIVSYNPLDNTTEIGSYPSPLEISSSNENRDAVNIESLIRQSNKDDDSKYYTNLVQKATMHVFSDEELKIYPGDEYQINLKDESKYIYEELEYYIIDENRNKYNVTKHIKENSNFNPVGWTVPGWMAVQYRLAAFEDFQMNIRSFVVPSLASDITGNLNLNFQLKISDNLLLKRLPDQYSKGHLDEIGLSVKIQKQKLGVKSASTIIVEDFLFDTIDGQVVEWYETSKILWAQKEFEIHNLNQGDKLTITVTPFIQVVVDNELYKVVYDNFTENLDVSLANIGSFSDFKIAKDLWKFWLEKDDDDNLYLEFDIAGPLITSNTVNLYYKIDQIGVTNLHNLYKQIESYNGIGQNMLLLPFNGDFKKEGIYIIEFVFANQDPNGLVLNKNNSYSVKKLVIASQIFSSFVSNVSNFDKITFDDWTAKYPETIKNADRWDVTVDSNNNILKSYSKGIISDDGISDVTISDCLKDFWKTGSAKNNYDHTAFITDDEWDSTIGEQTKFLRGYVTDANVKLETELDVLKGGLWDGMNRLVQIKIKSHDEELITNSYPVYNIDKELNLSLKPIVANECVVHYEKESEGLVRGSTSRNNIVSNIGGSVKYRVLLGTNNRYWFDAHVCTYLTDSNRILTEEGKNYSENVKLVDERNDNTSIPTPTSRAIASLINGTDIPFIILFVVTKTNNDNNNKAIGLYRNDEQMFYSVGKDVHMQPFVVFKNKQSHPIFFAIDGYDYIWQEDANTDENEKHDFKFTEWTNLSQFVKHINDSLSGFIKYNIVDIKDGYFIKCSSQINDLDSILNLETEINIPEISTWKIGSYNILNSTDRNILQMDLAKDDVEFGNLLTGITYKLNNISIEGFSYNNKIDTPDTVKDAMYQLENQISNIREKAITQWDAWRTDALYADAYETVISGIKLENENNNSADTFMHSALYDLIQKSDTDGTLTLATSGEKLSFQVVKKKGKELRQEASNHIGLIHSSITFP